MNKRHRKMKAQKTGATINMPINQANTAPVNEAKPRLICVGIPHMGLFHWHTVASLLSMQFPRNTKLTYHMIGSSLVYEARESIAKYAIDNNCEFVLYLDSDMVPPTDMIVKMVNIFDQRPEAGMITGMAFKRIPPFQPCFYTKLAYDTTKMMPVLESPIDWPATAGLIELQGCGMACCMVKTEVFRQIPKPWFFPLPALGEDLTFCLKAKQKGIKMYCDTSIDVGHISSMPITKEHFFACRDEHRRLNNGDPLFKEV